MSTTAALKVLALGADLINRHLSGVSSLTIERRAVVDTTKEAKRDFYPLTDSANVSSVGSGTYSLLQCDHVD